MQIHTLSNLFLCIYRLLLSLISTFQKNISIISVYVRWYACIQMVSKKMCKFINSVNFRHIFFVWHNLLSFYVDELIYHTWDVAYVVLGYLFCLFDLFGFFFFFFNELFGTAKRIHCDFICYVYLYVGSKKNVSSHPESQSWSTDSEI